jgi:sugar phosphate isomerase/epimerase
MGISMERRGLVKMGALAAGAAMLPASVRATGMGVEVKGEPSPVRLGMTSYTFREFPRAQVITWMKQLGLTTINCKDTKDHLPSTSVDAEMQAVHDYEAAGITITAAGTIYFKTPDEADIRAKFDYCKRAGVKVIVAGDPTAEVLPIVERFVKEYDIKFAIHNHGPEDPLWHSPLDVLKAVKGMDPRMGCCIDLGHTMRAGTDPVEAVRLVGPRLFDVHIKDLAKADAKDSQVAVGRGIMPVREIFQELVKIKYPGNVDLEYEIHGDDPLPGASESIAYMRGVLAGMGYKTPIA